MPNAVPTIPAVHSHIVTCDEAGRVRYRKRGGAGGAAVTVDFTASQHANRLRVSAADAHKIAVGGKV